MKSAPQMRGPTRLGMARLEMSMPNRIPVSCTGEICAVADPTSVNHAPERYPQVINPIKVGAVPMLGGVQNANMTAAERKPIVPKTFHTPTRSASIPVQIRPVTDPA